MTLIASIDGTVNPRLVYLHSDTVGASVHPIDIYKEARALRRTDESLRKFTNFMKADGNVTKGGGKFTERYVTLLDTRIVPFDTDHVLTITGTLITDDGLEGIFAFDKSPLSGGTSVDIAYIPPQVEIITVSTGGALTPEQDAKLTLIASEIPYIERAVHIDTELNTQGDGSQAMPFNTVEAALDFAEIEGLKLIHVLSDMTIDRNMKNFVVHGVGIPAIDCDGFNIDRSHFDHCTMKGDYSGSVVVQDSLLFDGFTLNGYFENCALSGILNSSSGAIIDIIKCVTTVRDSGYVIINGVNGSLSIRGFKGSIGMTNCSNGIHSVGLTEGSFIIDQSCDNSTIYARGIPFEIIDTSGVNCDIIISTESRKIAKDNWSEVL